jgi:hypothetical protein
MLKHKLTFLLTSVGSFVGKNILDSLDGRRDNIRIIGSNSIADAANNFRCDEVYLAPPAQETAVYKQRLLDIIEITQPDLILAGRDDDVGILAELGEDHPEIANRLPQGNVEIARIFDDKWLSYRFAKQAGIPFVDTARGVRDELAALVQKHGFPLIAKPARGNGSKGVLVLFGEDQLWRAAELADMVFQPFINPAEGLSDIPVNFACGMPLFYVPPVRGQIALQAIIDRSGRIQGAICTEHLMVAGRNERIIRLDDAKLTATAHAIAASFAEAGWRGCLNIQGRLTETGDFMAFEFNGRMTGGTSARLLLGLDEFGLLVRHFVGDGLLPPSPLLGAGDREIHEALACYVVKNSDSAALQNDRYWRSAVSDSDKG